MTTSISAPARLSRALARAARTAEAVDVGREHAPPQGARGGDGEHAGAGAEIENPRWREAGVCACLHRFAESVEREQAAAGGAVMAGAEGERRLDLDADGFSAERGRGRGRRARRSGRPRPA